MTFFVDSVIIFAILVVFVSNHVRAQDYKVLCYYTNWSNYRTGNGHFSPQNIDAKLCTHIVYTFAVLDEQTLIMKMSDPDIDTNLYRQITNFRQKGIKVIISIGGVKDSQRAKYGRLLTDENARENFITNAVDFIKIHHFDGLDLDFEYPSCWQGMCKSIDSPHKTGFSRLVKGLSEALKPRGLLLSATVSALFQIVHTAYDVPKLALHLHWITVMAYDFHGSWNQEAGLVAPRQSYPGNEANNYVEFAIKYWIKRGAPAIKLIVGCPAYGITYTLANPQYHDINAPTIGLGQAGSLTKSPGFLAYYEICDKIKNHGWTVVSNTRIGSYAFKGNQWVSFDDAQTMRFKAKYVQKKNLGGVMIWSLDFDDFRGTCGDGKYPLLSALNQGLRDKEPKIQSDDRKCFWSVFVEFVSNIFK